MDVPHLLRDLNAPVASVRRQAANEFLSHPDYSALEPLVKRVQADKDVEVRRAAAKALLHMCRVLSWGHHGYAQIGDPDLWPLVKAGPNVVPSLIAALDQEEDLAVPAALALGAIGDRRAEAPLFRTVAQRDGNTCGAALEGLCRLGVPDLVPRVLAVTKNQGWGYGSEPITFLIYELGPKAAPYVPAMLEKAEQIFRDGVEDATIKYSAPAGYKEKALQGYRDHLIGDLPSELIPHIIPFLLERAKQGDGTAIDRLARQRDSRILPLMRTIFADSKHPKWASAAVFMGVNKVYWAKAALLDALRDPQRAPTVAWAMSELGAVGSLPALRIASAQATPQQRWHFQLARARLGDETLFSELQALVEAHRSDKPVLDGFRAQYEAIAGSDNRSLMAIVAARKPQMFVGWLRCSEAKVRALAVDALRESSDPASRKALRATMSDPDGEVRERAASALAKDPLAVGLLIKALEDDQSVSREAMESLGELRDKAAVPYLVKKIGSITWTLFDPAVLALMKIGKSSFEPSLVAFQRSGMACKPNLAELLGEVGDKRAVPALLETLKSKDLELVLASAEALGRLGDRRAIAALGALARLHVRATEDDGLPNESELREAARGAVARIVWKLP